MNHSDLIVVGAGIMGLAHAYFAARAGLSVTVIERGKTAQGASIRNFGMLAVVAQAEGSQKQQAMQSLDTWLNIAARAKFEVKQSGCLILAREAEELDVLQEFISTKSVAASSSKLVSAAKLDRYSTALKTRNLLGGLWSEQAWKVDQRQAVNKIATWLWHEYKVKFYFSTDVTSVAPPLINTSVGTFHCEQAIVCGGSEFSALFPDAFSAAKVTQCELQMLRTHPQPANWQLKPFVLGGLSLPRYSAFAECTSMARLKEMQQTRFGAHLTFGIHTIACQEDDGSITLGDSHKYGHTHSQERSIEIDNLILEDLNSMIDLPNASISHRWLGHYAHLPGSEILKLSPAPQTMAITMTNGQGMTHAFAVAHEVINDMVG